MGPSGRRRSTGTCEGRKARVAVGRQAARASSTERGEGQLAEVEDQLHGLGVRIVGARASGDPRAGSAGDRGSTTHAPRRDAIAVPDTGVAEEGTHAARSKRTPAPSRVRPRAPPASEGGGAGCPAQAAKAGHPSSAAVARNARTRASSRSRESSTSSSSKRVFRPVKLQGTSTSSGSPSALHAASRSAAAARCGAQAPLGASGSNSRTLPSTAWKRAPRVALRSAGRGPDGDAGAHARAPEGAGAQIHHLAQGQSARAGAGARDRRGTRRGAWRW